MKPLFRRGLLLASLTLGVNQQALAHVHYTDITNLGAAGYDDSFVSYGWQQGTTPALATTDDVNWYSFTLAQASTISLSLAKLPDGGLTAPAFSLYSGLFVDQSFDVNPIIPLLPGQNGLVNTAASFSMTTDTNVLSIDQAHLRTINFITSATDGGTGTAQLMNFNLGPGDYSVIAGGNSPYNVADDGLSIYAAKISFAASPVSAVPLPAGVWLFGSGLMGLLYSAKRKAGQLAA
jgi:hypothetical protein